MAALSDRLRWVASPDPWISAPLVQIFDRLGQIVDTAGDVRPEPGRYLTWLSSRAVLGSRGDTILTLKLSSGDVEIYAAQGSAVYGEIAQFNLPAYFQPPTPEEEIQSWPWLERSSERFIHVHVSHVETAAFGGDRIYALRNYDAEWSPLPDRASLRTDGQWGVVEQGLEIYNLSGRRLASLSVDADAVSWLRVDNHGRIFLGSGDSIMIVRDPTSQPEFHACPPMPRRIELQLDDRPLPASTEH